MIDMTRMCEIFNSLPSSGGVMDQDCFLMEGMRMVKEADAARENREIAKAQREAEEAKARASRHS